MCKEAEHEGLKEDIGECEVVRGGGSSGGRRSRRGSREEIEEGGGNLAAREERAQIEYQTESMQSVAWLLFKT